jgi:hypothetical protein
MSQLEEQKKEAKGWATKYNSMASQVDFPIFNIEMRLI